ncbi:uncharacterized protein LOC113280167 [Papaver somniferum]|uniref:uncharacterized protein LOC113280167 n=1 Tax=Papaver somniferum TaxID=3469 RepID=UPI000E6FD94B|nr:uncharacterized protein LOC113280167 [Papaver somniferum]
MFQTFIRIFQQNFISWLKGWAKAWWCRQQRWACGVYRSWAGSIASVSLLRTITTSAIAVLRRTLEVAICTSSSSKCNGYRGKRFAMSDLGPLHHFLGITVTRSSSELYLSQSLYAQDIIARVSMTKCNPVVTPVDIDSKLSATSGPKFSDLTLYRSLAGALQYLAFNRPDIAYAVQQVSTISGLTAYSDADWAGCLDSRRSTSGFCIFLGDNLISWSSKRQATVSRSSAEAEYRGVANAVAETTWLHNLLLELHLPLHRATIVYCDNVSAIYMSGDPVQYQRTKHVEIDIHFVRERVRIGAIQVLHVPSENQYADIFTRGIP